MEGSRGACHLCLFRGRGQDGEGLGFPLACHRQGPGGGRGDLFHTEFGGPHGLSRTKLSRQQQRDGNSPALAGRGGEWGEAQTTPPVPPLSPLPPAPGDRESDAGCWLHRTWGRLSWAPRRGGRRGGWGLPSRPGPGHTPARTPPPSGSSPARPSPQARVPVLALPLPSCPLSRPGGRLPRLKMGSGLPTARPAQSRPGRGARAERGQEHQARPQTQAFRNRRAFLW